MKKGGKVSKPGPGPGPSSRARSRKSEVVPTDAPPAILPSSNPCPPRPSSGSSITSSPSPPLKAPPPHLLQIQPRKRPPDVHRHHER
ncbi:hypothetical protein CPC08DRAFT_716356 [Agrocybe pediades]|nr:hypothetical protein CPC08DRAFT_716356 [Agrocybe pediades]